MVGVIVLKSGFVSRYSGTQISPARMARAVRQSSMAMIRTTASISAEPMTRCAPDPVRAAKRKLAIVIAVIGKLKAFRDYFETYPAALK